MTNIPHHLAALGARVRTVRRGAGFTSMTALAAALDGVSAHTIGMIERGEHKNPSMTVLWRIEALCKQPRGTLTSVRHGMTASLTWDVDYNTRRIAKEIVREIAALVATDPDPDQGGAA